MTKTDVFIGVVVTSNAGSRAVTIIREGYAAVKSPDGGMMFQGIPVSTVMASYLGFKDCSLPQPGSRVICINDQGHKCYIIGVIPQQTFEVDGLVNRSSLGSGTAIDDSANRVGHKENTPALYSNRMASDVVDGEYVLGNDFGVLLGLYQQLATLKASELAQIQCYLLDDLVRIISHNFQHYTVLGEHNIYHDGKRIMAEFGATHKPSESYGSPAVESESGPQIFQEDGEPAADDSKDYYKISKDERIKAVERFKWFLGSVGDFLNVFLVRPHPEELRILDPEAEVKNPDTGLCNLHVGTDGGLHLRSVKEVFIEKSNWIRVPLRKAAPDDPNGDDAEELKYEEKKKFEFKDNYKYKNNPFVYALQLRDYIAYVNDKLGYQNFKSHEKDFYVNDEQAKEKQLNEIKKIDAETSLHLQEYKLRTAGVYLMPNGGITIRDAWNSAIVMEGGNIYIQPAKDLVTQPLRHNIVKAGGSINMACKRHIDLSTTEEGIRVKSKKSQYFYSDKSGFVMESNGTKDTPGSPDPAKTAIDDVGGIVFKSKLHIYSYAEKNIVSYAKKNLLLQSLDNTDIIADKTLTTYGKKSVLAVTDGSLFNYSKKSTTIVSDGGLVAAGARSTALGQDGQKLGVMYDKKSIFIDILYGVMKVSDTARTVKSIREAKDGILKQTTFQNEKMFQKLKFKFLDTYKYKLNPDEDMIPSTMAQQDDLLTDMYKLEPWEELKINETYPFPGKDLFENFYYKAEKPVNLEKKQGGGEPFDYINKPDAKEKPAEIKLDSLNTYKIQPEK